MCLSAEIRVYKIQRESRRTIVSSVCNNSCAVFRLKSKRMGAQIYSKLHLLINVADNHFLTLFCYLETSPP